MKTILHVLFGIAVKHSGNLFGLLQNWPQNKHPGTHDRVRHQGFEGSPNSEPNRGLQ